jgi:hypothetical protein
VRQGSGYPYDDDDDVRQPRDSPERRWWAHFRTGVRAAAAEMQAAGWLPADDVESAESYLFLGLPGGADPRVTCAAALHVPVPPCTPTSHNHRALET